MQSRRVPCCEHRLPPSAFVQEARGVFGRYDLTLSVEHFRDLFDGYYSENIYFNTPTHFLPGLGCEDRLKHLRDMDIVFTVGREDPFRDNNEHLSDILRGKGVNHALHLWDERAHQGYYWRRMAQIYV